MLLLFLFFLLLIFFFARAGGILRILQSDWLWERAEFFYPANPCVMILNFHFLTPNPFTYRSKRFKTDFSLGKRRGNRIQINIFLFETFSL